MAKGKKREKVPDGRWNKEYCTYRHFRQKLMDRFGTEINHVEYNALCIHSPIWNSTPPQMVGVISAEKKTTLLRWEVRLNGTDTRVFLIRQKGKGLKTCYTESMVRVSLPALYEGAICQENPLEVSGGLNGSA